MLIGCFLKRGLLKKALNIFRGKKLSAEKSFKLQMLKPFFSTEFFFPKHV